MRKQVLVSMLVLSVGMALGPAGAAGAEDDGRTAWSVAPASESGPDGRHWVELELDPGATFTDHFAVTNLSKGPAVFAIQAADGYFTAKGRFNMLDRPEESVEAGTWIKVQPQVEVGPGETVVVPFEVAVPADAEPGDHAAGIAAAYSQSGGESGGTGVGVVSRFGFRVMVRVAGALDPGLEIANVATAYGMSWNPFKPGRLTVGFDLVNTGNARLKVTGTVAAGEGPKAYPAESEPVVELLPGASRHVEVAVGGVWPLFVARAQITAAPEVLALEGVVPPELGPIDATAGATAIPWPQLMVLAGLGLLVWGLLAGRARSRRQLAAMLDKVRAEERARVAASQYGPTPEPASPRTPAWRHAGTGQ